MKTIWKNLLFIASVSVAFFVLRWWQPTWVYSGISYILTFFGVLLLLGERIQHLLNPVGEMPTAHLASVALRLFLGAGFAAVFLYFDRQNQLLFVANFFVVYLIFLAFEILGLLSNLRAHSQNPQD